MKKPFSPSGLSVEGVSGVIGVSSGVSIGGVGVSSGLSWDGSSGQGHPSSSGSSGSSGTNA